MAVAFRSKTYLIGTSTNSTATEPAGTVQGDVLVGLCVVDSPGFPLTLPSGWTTIVNETSNSGFFGAGLNYIVRGASAPALTWTHGNAYRELAVLCFSGVDNTSPLDVTAPATVKTTNTSTKPDPPTSGASATASAWALAMHIMWGNAPAGGWTAQAGYTLREGATTDATIAVSTKALGGAGTNDDPAVFGATPQSANDGWAETLLLRPAADSEVPPPNVVMAPSRGRRR